MGHYRYPPRDCEVCGAEFRGLAPRVRTCSVECGGVLRRRGNNRFGYLCSVAFPTCAACGTTFSTRFVRQRVCSEGCRLAVKRDTEARRRALKLGAHVEPYSRTQIALRDGYSCGICSSAVDMSLRHPHPLSASIDHVIPLSRGGADAPSNVQLAHFVCNVSKGARMLEEAGSNR